MRIALLAPLVSPIAPPYLGGAQALLADLAAGLARRGHTVTLYAADGSAVPGVDVPELGIDWRQLTPARLFVESSTENETAEIDDDDEELPADPAVYRSDYA